MRSIDIRTIDITELNTDIIVNAANTGLQAGGGVCGAIFRAAGYMELQAACDQIGHCDTGSAVITSGFRLKAKYVIHAVGPIWQGGTQNEPQMLYSCYRESLQLAQKYHCHSIGFPLISSGIYGYPKDKAWRKAIQACHDFLQKNQEYDLEIIFAVLDDESLAMGRDILHNIAPEDEKVIELDWAEMPEQKIPAVKTDSLIIEGRNVPAIYFHLPGEHYGFLSNWYMSDFVLDGIKFNSNEKYIMYRKAKLLGDDETAEAILAADTPAEHQRLGQKAKGYNDALWHGMRQMVAARGLYAKFAQNEKLKKQLLETDDAYLVECAYNDLNWACGWHLHDDERKYISKWRGKNLLGFALMAVREQIRAEMEEDSENSSALSATSQGR